jgi:hypothetical protein
MQYFPKYLWEISFRRFSAVGGCQIFGLCSVVYGR